VSAGVLKLPLSFNVLQMLAPTMTVAEFAARTASAFHIWPAVLLTTELDRNAFVSTTESDLFEGNPDGWNAYVAHLREKVTWFGKGGPKAEKLARKKPPVAVAEEASPAEPSADVSPHVGQTAPEVKTTWPWPKRDWSS
jgi:hypothetical protein